MVRCVPTSRSSLPRFAMTGLLLTACTAPADPAAGEPPPIASNEYDAIFAEYAGGSSPGCAVGVARGGKLVFAKGYGVASLEDGRPITLRTAFNIGSIAKQFTALAILLLEAQGTLSRGDDVRRWVPELPDFGAPIRIQDLLQHTSGLRDFNTLATLAQRPILAAPAFLAAMAAQDGLNFPTGTRHEYSHSDYVVLGLVVERAAGVPYADYLQREILGPLGMRWTWMHDGRGPPRGNRALAHAMVDSGFRVRFPQGELVGENNLYSTVEDLLRWEGNFHQPVVGGRALVDRMLERPRLASGEPIPYAYGLQFGEYRGLPTIRRGGGGGGFATELIRFPDQRLAVATLCNVTPSHPRYLAQAVAERSLRRQLGPAVSDSVTDIVAPPPGEMEQLSGYYGEPSEAWNLAHFEVRQGALHEVLGGEAFRLDRLDNGQYHSEGVFYTFARTADGSPASVTLRTLGSSEQLARMPAEALWRPDAATLAALAGTWYSRELDAAWDLVVTTEGLGFQFDGGFKRLWPMQQDGFIAMLGTGAEFLMAGLTVHRDGAGLPVALVVDAEPTYEAVRGVRFGRVPR